MSGCGEPYQIESVPHTMRSGPTARSSLPSTCAASTGRRSIRYQVLPSSAYTLAPGRDRPRRPGSRPAGRRPVGVDRVERALLAVGVALVARVVHEEGHVGERRRGRADVARRRGRHRRRRDRAAEPLVHRHDRACPTRGRARGTGTRSRRRRGTSRRSATPRSAGRRAGSTSSPTAGARRSRRPCASSSAGAEVGVHDGVRQHPAGARVAVDQLAGRGDLRVEQHVVVGVARASR